LDMHTSTSSANIYNLSVGSGGLSVLGNFTINGTTIYNTRTFVLSAGTPMTTGTYAQFGAYRTSTGGTSANSYIRWNETAARWDATANSDPNSGANYYNLLWTNDLSDSVTTTSSTTVASATAVKTANALAQASYNSQNITAIFANSAFGQANSAASFANGAFGQANTAASFANGAFGQANSAASFANGAFTAANTWTTFKTTGGVIAGAVGITGDLGVTGNLAINGSVVYSNVATFQTVDSLIELAANNLTDTVDIGFYGQYVNSGTYYTGLTRKAGGNYYLFQGLTCNPTGNNIGTICASQYATLYANYCGCAAGITCVPNAALVNPSLTVNGIAISLGQSCTVTAAAGTLTGSTLASGVTTSSLTTVGTLTSGAIGSGFTAIPNTALSNSSVTVNGVAIGLGQCCTVTAAAGTLTGSTLSSGVTQSSLTSVGTIGTGTWNGSVISACYGGTGVAGTLTGVLYGNGTSAHTCATAAQIVGAIGTTAVCCASIAGSAGCATYAGCTCGNVTGSASSATYASCTCGNVTGCASSATYALCTCGNAATATYAGCTCGNVTGSAYNITAYTINQNLGTSNTPTFCNVCASTFYASSGVNTASVASPAANLVNAVGNGYCQQFLVNGTQIFAVSSSGISMCSGNITGSLSGCATCSGYAALAGNVCCNQYASTGTYPMAWFSGTTMYATTGVCVCPVSCAIIAACLCGGATYASCTCGNAASATTATYAGCTCGNVTGTAYNITAYTINQSVGTGNDVQHNSLGLGTAASGTSGALNAVGPIQISSTGSIKLSGGTIGSPYYSYFTAYNISVSSPSPAYSITVNSNCYSFDTSGNFTAPANITAYSDARLKTNVKTIENALDKTMKLRGVTFDKDGKAGIGVIAQEIREVLPEVVVEAKDDDKTLSVAYGNVVGLLIEAIKELKAEIEELKKGK